MSPTGGNDATGAEILSQSAHHQQAEWIQQGQEILAQSARHQQEGMMQQGQEILAQSPRHQQEGMMQQRQEFLAQSARHQQDLGGNNAAGSGNLSPICSSPTGENDATGVAGILS